MTLCYLAWLPLILKAWVNIQIIFKQALNDDVIFHILAFMKAILYRTSLLDRETLGELQVGDFKCYTLELPWKENQRRVSCIPEGTYRVTKHTSPKFGKTFWVRDVPDRDAVLIHPGNYNYHTLGCILVGSNHEDRNKDGLLDVVNSKFTMAKLLEYDITEIEIKTI